MNENNFIDIDKLFSELDDYLSKTDFTDFAKTFNDKFFSNDKNNESCNKMNCGCKQTEDKIKVCKDTANNDEKEGNLFTAVKQHPEGFVIINDFEKSPYETDNKVRIAMMYEIYGSQSFFADMNAYCFYIKDGKLISGKFSDAQEMKRNGAIIVYGKKVFYAYSQNISDYYNTNHFEDAKIVSNDYITLFRNRNEHVIYTDVVGDDVTKMLKAFYFGVPYAEDIDFGKKERFYYIDFLTYRVMVSSDKELLKTVPDKIVKTSELLKLFNDSNDVHNISKRYIDTNMVPEIEDYTKDPKSAKFNDTFEMVKQRPYMYVIKIDHTDNLTRMVLRQLFDNSQVFEIFDALQEGDVVYQTYNNYLFYGPRYEDVYICKRYSIPSAKIVEDFKKYHWQCMFKGITKYLLKDNFVDDYIYGYAAESFFNLNGLHIYTDVMNQDVQNILKAMLCGADNFDCVDFSQKNKVYTLDFYVGKEEVTAKASIIDFSDDICGAPVMNASELLKHITPITKKEEDKNENVCEVEVEEIPHVDTEKYAKSVEGVLDAAKELYRRKNHDYSINGKSGFDKAWDRMGRQSLWLRLNDKFSRVESLLFANDEQQVQDEKLEDTLIDIINYCAMGISKIENEK